MTDRRLIVLIVAATSGCMRIYPDPELPDVIVEWGGDGFNNCGDDGVTVRMEAVADDGTLVSGDAPCAEGKGRIEDLARASHMVTAVLLDASGAILGRTAPSEVDLSKGLSRRAYASLFTREGGYFRVAWTFSGGDTCASLGASTVIADVFGEDGGGPALTMCEEGQVVSYFPLSPGTYTMQLSANRELEGTEVAVSAPRHDVVIPDRGAVVDLGTVELTRCASVCERLQRPEPRRPDGPGGPDGPEGPEGPDGPEGP